MISLLRHLFPVLDDFELYDPGATALDRLAVHDSHFELPLEHRPHGAAVENSRRVGVQDIDYGNSGRAFPRSTLVYAGPEDIIVVLNHP